MCGRILMFALLAVSAFAQSDAKALLDNAKKRLAVAQAHTGDGRLERMRACVPLFERARVAAPIGSRERARSGLETGRILKRLGDLSAAEVSYRDVVAEGPAEEAVDALHELATLHRSMRRVDAAVADLEIVLVRYPTQTRACAEALVRLASLHRAERRVPEARSVLSRCLDHYIEHRTVALDALEAWVALEVGEGDFGTARRVFEHHGARIRWRCADVRSRVSTENGLAKIAVRLAAAPKPATSHGDGAPSTGS